jgi:hypothetical protein
MSGAHVLLAVPSYGAVTGGRVRLFVTDDGLMGVRNEGSARLPERTGGGGAGAVPEAGRRVGERRRLSC